MKDQYTLIIMPSARDEPPVDIRTLAHNPVELKKILAKRKFLSLKKYDSQLTKLSVAQQPRNLNSSLIPQELLDGKSRPLA